MANSNDDILVKLRDDCYECQQEAADEIERLRKERDEARRWFCYEARQAGDRKNSEIRAKEIADIFFWDCFKENS